MVDSGVFVKRSWILRLASNSNGQGATQGRTEGCGFGVAIENLEEGEDPKTNVTKSPLSKDYIAGEVHKLENP